MQILQNHLFSQHLAHYGGHIVAVAELGVEGKGHAVMGAALLAGLPDGGAELVLLGFSWRTVMGVGFWYNLNTKQGFCEIQ